MKCCILSIFTLNETDSYSVPFFYAVWILFPFVAVSLVLTLNLTFTHFPQLEVVPTYQSGSVILNVVFGGIIFNEFSNYSTEQLISFAIGLSICLSGMIIMLIKDSH